MDCIAKSHWTHGCRERTLEGVTTDLKTPETTTTTTTTTTAPAAAPAPVRPSRLAALRRAIRTRRANRSELSRQIAAYPAMRSASTTALLTGRTVR